MGTRWCLLDYEFPRVGVQRHVQVRDHIAEIKQAVNDWNQKAMVNIFGEPPTHTHTHTHIHTHTCDNVSDVLFRSLSAQRDAIQQLHKALLEGVGLLEQPLQQVCDQGQAATVHLLTLLGTSQSMCKSVRPHS